MTSLRPVAIWLGAQRWLPRFAPVIVWLDRLVQRLTRGRLSLNRIAGVPGLTLTVPGMKTGLPRSTPMLCTPYDGGYLVAGTNWGRPHAPAWVANLEAAGAAEISVHGRRMPVRARRLEGSERAAAWDRMVENWPNYSLYEERVAPRRIKVFLLSPAS